MDHYDDVLALGVESMDTEHRRLAALFEEFADCVKKKSLHDRVPQIVEEALLATNAHFEHEEALMAAAGYPGIEEEKFQHRHLRLKLTTLVGDTLNTGACDPITLEHLDEMRRLLLEHFTGPDKQLATFLIARRAA